jgi:hypothetical protein
MKNSAVNKNEKHDARTVFNISFCSFEFHLQMDFCSQKIIFICGTQNLCHLKVELKTSGAFARAALFRTAGLLKRRVFCRLQYGC